jgi:NAD(P)H-dependent FMN reductase
MSQPKIAIVVGTTRAARFADRPKDWILDLAKSREDATFEVVDLRDHPLPFFGEDVAPVYAPPKNDAALAFGQLMDGYDGYLFITAEYNHSFSGVLKNALDHLYGQLTRKPAAYLGYGGVGAARAIEQLRLVHVELQMAPLRNAVHIGLMEFRGLLRGGKDFADFPYLGEAADVMLDDLVWWSRTLKAGRGA